MTSVLPAPTNVIFLFSGIGTGDNPGKESVAFVYRPTQHITSTTALLQLPPRQDNEAVVSVCALEAKQWYIPLLRAPLPGDLDYTYWKQLNAIKHGRALRMRTQGEHRESAVDTHGEHMNHTGRPQ